MVSIVNVSYARSTSGDLAGGRRIGPVFSPWFERSSYNPSGCFITGEGSDAVVTIAPNTELEAFLDFSHQVEQTKDKQFEFRVTNYSGSANPWVMYGKTRKPHFCYPLVNPRAWYPFDNLIINTTDNRLEFWHNTPFAHDVVRVGRGRQWTVHNAGDWLANLAAQYPSIVRPAPSAEAFTVPEGDLADYAAHEFVANTFSAHTGPYGQWIDKTPFYAAVLDDPDLSPIGGGAKRIMPLVAGVHASEDYGDYAFLRGVEHILGDSDEAIYLRQHYKFLLYPIDNPTGRAAGLARTSYISRTGSPTVHDDPNRRWNVFPANNETIDKPRAAIDLDLDTLGEPTTYADFHGSNLGSIWGLVLDSLEPNDGVLASKITAKTGLSIQDDANTPAGSITDYMTLRGAKLSITVEFGDPEPQTDLNANKFSDAFFDSIADMDAEDYFD